MGMSPTTARNGNVYVNDIVYRLVNDTLVQQVSRGSQFSPVVGVENSPPYAGTSAGLTKPALSLSLSRYELPRVLTVMA